MQVPVPNVVGQPVATATAALQNAGFVVNSTTAASPTVANGAVISTNPPADTERAKGSAVQLVVSTGKPQVAIPSLVGDTPTLAGQALGALGLKVYQANEPVGVGARRRGDPDEPAVRESGADRLARSPSSSPPGYPRSPSPT